MSLSQSKGLNNHKMVDAIHDGKLKSLYIMGEDMAIVDANANHVQAAFEKLEFMVVQDLFMTVTARYADVILPATASLEKEGTFVNTERRIQRLYRVLEPYADTRPDWWILTELAKRMGQDWGFEHPSEVMDEIAPLTPMFAGVTYERLEGYKSLQWPVAEDGTDTPLLYTEKFHFDDGKARLFALEWKEPSDQPGEEYDLHLNNGRLLEHFHAGIMTYPSAGIEEKVPNTFVELSPDLAQERNIESGDWVRLSSPRGHVRVQALVTERVQGNELYMPMNSSGQPVNLLTSSKVDRTSDTPLTKNSPCGWKNWASPARLPCPATTTATATPPPKTASRYERKWERGDYVFPNQTRPPGGNV